ncbi:uncharacterized protein LOC62_01G001565 [Vanrija pseudolonga]|uniref:Uncharacterized protein n=1 Tax=Vanrija pseudolonga TaxID=143232 RepID=A0AAF1BFF9_9TREE|nr:hypothetical protein LOC62_01G001565 [Vanrija pseudolonga]
MTGQAPQPLQPPQYVVCHGNTTRKLRTLADWGEWYIGLEALLLTLNAPNHLSAPEPYRETNYDRHIWFYQPRGEKCGDRPPEGDQIAKGYGLCGSPPREPPVVDRERWMAWARKERLVRAALLTTVDSALLLKAAYTTLWSSYDIVTAVSAILFGPSSYEARVDNRRRLLLLHLDHFHHIKRHFLEFEELAPKADILPWDKVAIFRRGLVDCSIRAKIDELCESTPGVRLDWDKFARMYKAATRAIISEEMDIKPEDWTDDFFDVPADDTAS